MDLVKILRNLRNLKIFTKNIGLKGVTKLRIKNQGINILDLNEIETEDSSYL
jgi:hypothetical protein